MYLRSQVRGGLRVIARNGQALLYVEMDCPPEMEEEFHTWYNTEHLPERLGFPGFLQARRYAALIGRPRWLATYELRDPSVLESPEYLSHYGDFQSPWTKRVTSVVEVHRRTFEVAWTSLPNSKREVDRAYGLTSGQVRSTPTVSQSGHMAR